MMRMPYSEECKVKVNCEAVSEITVKYFNVKGLGNLFLYEVIGNTFNIQRFHTKRPLRNLPHYSLYGPE